MIIGAVVTKKKKGCKYFWTLREIAPWDWLLPKSLPNLLGKLILLCLHHYLHISPGDTNQLSPFLGPCESKVVQIKGSLYTEN